MDAHTRRVHNNNVMRNQDTEESQWKLMYQYGLQRMLDPAELDIAEWDLYTESDSEEFESGIPVIPNKDYENQMEIDIKEWNQVQWLDDLGLQRMLTEDEKRDLYEYEMECKEAQL